VLEFQHHADVAVVIDRHAAAKVVCCCHKLIVQTVLVVVSEKQELKTIAEKGVSASAVFKR
jgi:hypothetical protein